jgi:hypothetical protein
MPESDLHELTQWLAAHQDVKKLNVEYPDQEDSGIPITDMEVMVGVGVNGEVQVRSLREEFEKYRTHPRDYRGLATLQDLDSFIAHVNRFKDGDSAIWCTVDIAKPGLQAVLDYHEARRPVVVEAVDDKAAQEDSPATPHARFGRHRSLYPFPLSAEWLAWIAQNKKWMGQSDFAAFLEDRILDVVERKDDNLSPRLLEMSNLLGGKFAGPSSLVELSRGMAIHQSERFKQATNLSTGETQIQYESTHQDTQGQPLKVPNLFLIAIPIWRMGVAYMLPVRLRYRLTAGSLAWCYEISYLQESFEAAVKDAATKAKADTGLPLFYGDPEG